MTVKGDTVLEDYEYFNVVLAGPGGGASAIPNLGNATEKIQILNDEKLSLTGTSPTESEGKHVPVRCDTRPALLPTDHGHLHDCERHWSRTGGLRDDGGIARLPRRDEGDPDGGSSDQLRLPPGGDRELLDELVERIDQGQPGDQDRNDHGEHHLTPTGLDSFYGPRIALAIRGPGARSFSRTQFRRALLNDRQRAAYAESSAWWRIAWL